MNFKRLTLFHFRIFMELALYHPQFGYYMRTDEAVRSDGAKEQIGWDGDYYTSCDMHPLSWRSRWRNKFARWMSDWAILTH